MQTQELDDEMPPFSPSSVDDDVRFDNSSGWNKEAEPERGKIAPRPQRIEENGGDSERLLPPPHPKNDLDQAQWVYRLGDFELSLRKENWRKGGRDGDSNYLAPEVVQHEHFSPAADFFSFGQTLHFMVTGNCVPPRYISTGKGVLKQPRFPISDRLRQVIGQLLQENPKRRCMAVRRIFAELFQSLSLPVEEWTLQPEQAIRLGLSSEPVPAAVVRSPISESRIGASKKVEEPRIWI